MFRQSRRRCHRGLIEGFATEVPPTDTTTSTVISSVGGTTVKGLLWGGVFTAFALFPNLGLSGCFDWVSWCERLRVFWRDFRSATLFFNNNCSALSSAQFRPGDAALLFEDWCLPFSPLCVETQRPRVFQIDWLLEKYHLSVSSSLSVPVARWSSPRPFPWSYRGSLRVTGRTTTRSWGISKFGQNIEWKTLAHPMTLPWRFSRPKNKLKNKETNLYIY